MDKIRTFTIQFNGDNTKYLVITEKDLNKAVLLDKLKNINTFDIIEYPRENLESIKSIQKAYEKICSTL